MTSEHSSLHRQVRDLPEIQPPLQLEARILRARRSTLRRLGAVFAVGCLACGAAVMALLLQPGESPEPSPGITIAESAVTPSEELRSQIVAIDQALQNAYDNNAHSDEIASLWLERERLVVAREYPNRQKI